MLVALRGIVDDSIPGPIPKTFLWFSFFGHLLPLSRSRIEKPRVLPHEGVFKVPITFIKGSSKVNEWLNFPSFMDDLSMGHLDLGFS